MSGRRGGVLDAELKLNRLGDGARHPAQAAVAGKGEDVRVILPAVTDRQPSVVAEGAIPAEQVGRHPGRPAECIEGADLENAERPRGHRAPTSG